MKAHSSVSQSCLCMHSMIAWGADARPMLYLPADQGHFGCPVCCVGDAALFARHCAISCHGSQHMLGLLAAAFELISFCGVSCSWGYPHPADWFHEAAPKDADFPNPEQHIQGVAPGQAQHNAFCKAHHGSIIHLHLSTQDRYGSAQCGHSC